MCNKSCLGIIAVAIVLLCIGVQHLVTPVALEFDGTGRAILGTNIPLLPIIQVVNFAMEPFKRQLLPIDQKTMHALAFNKGEGLEDCVDSELLDAEGLQLALKDMDYMHFVGRFTHRDTVANLLALQWRICQVIKAHPEVLNEVIDRPVVLTGLLRSGTTFFYQVLADSGMELRNPTFWEAFGGPVLMKPLSKDDVGTERDPRIAKASEQLSLVSKLMPSTAVLHEWHSLTEPEEEVPWLAAAFNSISNAVVSNDVEVVQHLGRLNTHRVKYQFLKRLLQVMQWENFQETGKRPRWLLKSPEHINNMEEMVSVFPDMKLVVITRDPLTAFKSSLILKHHLTALVHHTPSVEVSTVYTEHTTCKGLAGIDRLPQLPVNSTVITFKEVTSDTMATAQRVAAAASLEWSVNVEKRISDGIERRAALHKKRFGMTYRMSDFGLDDDKIRERISLCPRLLQSLEESRNLRHGTDCGADDGTVNF